MRAKLRLLMSVAIVVFLAVERLRATEEPSGAEEPSSAEESSADVLQDIVGDMNSAAVQLNRLQTGEPAQTAQQSALKRLDRLIVTLEKRRAARRGGAVDPNATRPANESTIRNGPGGMGKLHAERRDGKQWAELPAKERQRILQSMDEGFPSNYQRILERYFTRLAEEKPTGDVPAVDEPQRDSDAKGSQSKLPTEGQP